MPRITGARVLMTLILLGGSALSFALDWRSNHLLNPLWVPHARFHGALLLFFLAGISSMGTWLLWRKSAEPRLAFKICLHISIAYWTPLFYVPFALPSSSWWAGRPGAEPRIDGFVFYPNLVVAAIFLAGSYLAYRLSGRETS
ncbi:MAG TPA: hypothetical protein VF730_15425 [Terracidiphilus sp.]